MPVVLVIQHAEAVPPALFGDWLREAGCTLDVRHCDRGDGLPEIKGYDGLLVLGGGMDADDDAGHPWLPLVRRRIAEAAEAGVPTLGICLGLQLATLALGGTVGRNPAGVLLGLLPVGWGCEVLLDPLVDRIAGEVRAVHWNQDVVRSLPAGADVLATGPHGEVQVARLAPTVWGVQFHPEADEAVVAAWAEEEPTLLAATDLTAAQVIGETTAARAELEQAWRPLAVAFAGMVKGRAAACGGPWS
jgi:GMP synthase-like glutamine amidotransferase